MKLQGQTALVSGGASGLGLATVEKIVAAGGRAVVLDLPTSPGAEVAGRFGTDVAAFVPGDVRDDDAVRAAVARTQEWGGPRLLVHTAGVGGPLRLLAEDGSPGDRAAFERVIGINLVGTYNVLRHVAAAMAALEPVDGERGVCVLTSSIAAWEGRTGQVHYAASKSGVNGMVLPAARDLASKLIRVCSIAPGVFDTPIIAGYSEEIRAGLTAEIPHPRRLGHPEEYAALALHIAENPMLNGEVIRLDGAQRLSAR
ncbi:NAD(P)-dependent dehydrogenase, short-chain alcohol dehydrogenase family [Pseudonocardia thermophila]|uniref:NAD(P)-dependent dehydrogenase, short-chain alcohol dehydrogenase family n=1 Tax=Pseudonocardia thermophila TaxID=1848 RepID=A0A1M6WQW1_PSETH|nr:SDR family NAD(P)-dependent oxidoreductase [Pseudonocardia thermophila]SHK96117.1 NAD(P)-dependent dehydrogenase, short-chain alcohol dehydrogenase family [Pseudonocardia thermophila]